MDNELQSLSNLRGTYILSASTGLQAAMESEKSGVFTKHLIEGISHWKAADDEGNITVDNLYNYILKQMIEEGFQRPMKWDLNVEGELIIASSNKYKNKKQTKDKVEDSTEQIRTILLKSYSSKVLPPLIFHRAIRIIDSKSDDLRMEDVPYSNLFHLLLNEPPRLDQFIDEWYKIEYSSNEDGLYEDGSTKVEHILDYFSNFTGKKEISEANYKTIKSDSSLNDLNILGDWIKHDRAITPHSDVVEINPQGGYGGYSKGNTISHKGRHNKATKAYDEAIRLDPKNAKAWYDKGVALKAQRDTDEAIEAFNEAIRLDPKNAKAWYNKGLALSYKGRYNDAIQAYERAIENNSEFSDAWEKKGIALMRLNHTNEGRKALAKAKQLSPEHKNAVAWFHKGEYLRNQYKYDEAIKAYERAIKLDPNYALSWANIGECLKRQHRYEEAYKAYDKAFELDPKNGHILSNRRYF